MSGQVKTLVTDPCPECGGTHTYHVTTDDPSQYQSGPHPSIILWVLSLTLLGSIWLVTRLFGLGKPNPERWEKIDDPYLREYVRRINTDSALRKVVERVKADADLHVFSRSLLQEDVGHVRWPPEFGEQMLGILDGLRAYKSTKHIPLLLKCPTSSRPFLQGMSRSEMDRGDEVTEVHLA